MAGLLNGLIALGGGVLITPMLVAAGIAPQVAVGTSLAAVTMLSSFGFLVHLIFVGVPLGVVPIMICVVGGITGTWIGSKLLARITPQWMLMLFALVQIAVAIRLIDQGLGSDLLGNVQTSAPPSWVYAALGLFAGTLSGLFGVGGGALVLLGLAAFYGVPVAEGSWPLRSLSTSPTHARSQAPTDSPRTRRPSTCGARCECCYQPLPLG